MNLNVLRNAFVALALSGVSVSNITKATIIVIVCISLLSGCTMTDFTKAAATGDIEAIATNLAQGADVNEVDSTGYTALYHAAGAGHKKVVQKLLAAGANPNIKLGLSYHALGQGHTALLVATQNGHIEIVKYLLAAGADVNAINELLQSPLGEAVKLFRRDLVSLLIAAGANPSQYVVYSTRTSAMPTMLSHSIFGRTGLFSLEYNSDIEITRILLVAGANPNQEDIAAAYADGSIHSTGNTPLVWAVRNGNIEAVKMLVAAGAGTNFRTPDGVTLMSMANNSLSYNPKAAREIITILIQHGVRPENLKRESNDMFIKLFATAAIAAGAASSDIPIENATDITSASMKDIWQVGGKDNRQTEKFTSMLDGSYQITDPVLRALAETRQRLEQQQQEVQQQLSLTRAQQEQQRKSKATTQGLGQQQLEMQQPLSLTRAQLEQQEKLHVGKTMLPQAKPKQLPTNTVATVQNPMIFNSTSVTAADDKGCWSGNYSGGSCLEYNTYVKKNKTYFELTNKCEERIYMKWCADDRCGSDGLRGGQTKKKYEYVTNAKIQVWAIGSNKPVSDWTCKSRIGGW